jgi:hypothetical protein
MKNTLFIILLFVFSVEINPQPQQIKNFFDDLIKNHPVLSQYLHPEALEESKRLNITYEDVPNKFLISYDIDESIKEKINKGELSYQLSYKQLEDDFSNAVFKTNENNYSKGFYFRNEMLVSPSSYFIRNWEKKELKYFKIFLSDPVLFNGYSVEQLDYFVDVMLDLLNVTQSEKELLEKEKINYILCKDADEIEKVSGFNTRGIYILAYDEIITTYNCHFHEIAHLLINFRLKNLPLYTLPFLQEGFATAVGGRGGLGRNVLLDIGYFLDKSRFIPFNSIVTKSEFLSEDASMTYPVAALYNLFLMEELGIESYLDLYLTYSGDADYISNLSLDSIIMPPIENFYAYRDNYKKQNGIFLEVNEDFRIITESKAGTIMESENFYLMKIRSNLLLKTSVPLSNYKSNPAKSGSPLRSKKFEEVFPGINYAGYKYLIKADSREVYIYNLYTNILIASYCAGFTTDNKEVTTEEGYFIFYVSKDLFEEEISEIIISDI